MSRTLKRIVTRMLAVGLLSNADAFAAQEVQQNIGDITRSLESSIEQLGMKVSAEERQAIASTIASAREVSRIAHQHNSPTYGDHYRRDAHAKATGCLRAEFEVNGDIPAQFRHSIFAEPGESYKAWIRFSNGDMLVQADGKGDARGMAVKVMGTRGEAIAPELESANQDFIMTDTPAFFNRNIFDYAENMQHLARLDRRGWFASLWPPRLHLTEMLRAYQTVSSKIDNPLGEQYFSMLPYRLGKTAVKYSSRPCAGARYSASVDRTAGDYLTQQMSQSLESDSACFEFLVQPRNSEAEEDMPLDDATVIWDQGIAPFIPIARIHIPPQTFTGESQQQFCENLSMNPWRGIGEWEPLGSLNRARRLVYHAVSEFRHQRNGAPQEEPNGWCIPGAEEPCSPQQGLNITKPTWPLARCFDHAFRPVDGRAPNSQCGASYADGYGNNSSEKTASY